MPAAERGAAATIGDLPMHGSRGSTSLSQPLAVAVGAILIAGIVGLFTVGRTTGTPTVTYRTSGAVANVTYRLPEVNGNQALVEALNVRNGTWTVHGRPGQPYELVVEPLVAGQSVGCAVSFDGRLLNRRTSTARSVLVLCQGTLP
ncbi:MAG: hypothetical protein ACYC1D_10530 [Acidimicrobiales bacterium]